MATDNQMNQLLTHVTVTRDDQVYEAFPDICLLQNGKILCVYRESDVHIATTTRIMLTESEDQGKNWTQPREIVERKSFIDHRAVWHDPRIKYLNDGRLVLNCALQIFPNEAESPLFPENKSGYQTFLWFSKDDGKTWTGPNLTEIEGLCADRIYPVRDDLWLLAIQRWSIRFPGNTMRVQVAHSFDSGITWPVSAMVAEQDGVEHDEPSIIPLNDGRLLCIMRENTHTTRPSQYVTSTNKGKSWSEPSPTPFYGDRPSGGMLNTGEILVTYRNVEPAIGEKKLNVGRNPGTWAWLGDMDGISGLDGKSHFLEIERDSSGFHGDYGYSAWIQFDNDEILCVYHHREDAPKSFIRGSWFDRANFLK